MRKKQHRGEGRNGEIQRSKKGEKRALGVPITKGIHCLEVKRARGDSTAREEAEESLQCERFLSGKRGETKIKILSTAERGRCEHQSSRGEGPPKIERSRANARILPAEGRVAAVSPDSSGLTPGEMRKGSKNYGTRLRHG